MQTGKKKLILDHLIVQKMDDENGSREDVQSILLYGAKALFEETEETVAAGSGERESGRARPNNAQTTPSREAHT